jgi:protein subunit release factor B
MRQNADIIENSRKELKAKITKTREQENEKRDEAKQIDIPADTLETLINQTEECLYDHFPPTKNSHSYINLGREAVIVDSFSKMRQEEGLEESKTVTKVKGRKVLSEYDSHL